MSKKSAKEQWLEFLSSLTDEEYAQYVDSGIPEIPVCDSQPWTTDYSTRGPNDFVISGPLGDAVGRGRRFPTISAAFLWAKGKYGEARVRVVRQDIRDPDHEEEWPARWAILVKR